MRDISQQIKTERGRAWITARWKVSRDANAAEEKISFPAIIVIDRSDPRSGMLRIEAMDPFGATHALIILNNGKKLTWADYDQKKIYSVLENWNGLPLTQLPELLLGLAALPESGRVGSANADGFELRDGYSKLNYSLGWIDPGPRLALAGIEGDIRGERYIVRNAKFLDKDDFYLPQEVSLKGFPSGSQAPQLEISIAWRERRWNETIPESLFQLPKKVLEEFARQ